MRTEVHDRQIDIVTLNTHLQRDVAPSNELRSHKAGRLYVKSGPPKTQGKSASRLRYQAGGADYLGKSVCLALRERKVQHVDLLAKSILDAARPESQRRPDEPDRYLVRHAQAMARMIMLAEHPAARPLGFEKAVGLAAAHWVELSKLDDKGVSPWWNQAVRKQLASARRTDQKATDATAQPLAECTADDVLDPALFERKDRPAAARLVPPPTLSAAQQSSAQAQRQLRPPTWHDGSAHPVVAEHKYGPARSAAVPQPSFREALWIDTQAGQAHAPPIILLSASPSPSMFATTQSGPPRVKHDAVIFHSSPAKEIQRVQGYLDHLCRGVCGADYLLKQLNRDDLPRLMSLMRDRMDALMGPGPLRRDAKAQAQDWQVWHSYAQLCGEACADEGLGEHVLTRAQVLQFPLKQRLNMLAALDGVQQHVPQGRTGMADLDAQGVMTHLKQQLGLMSAFTDAELLPPSDEVRAKALRVRLQTLGQGNPGAALTTSIAQEVAQAHSAAYALTGKPLSVVASPTLKPPFSFSADRTTLQVSTAPRPAGEQPGAVMRQLVIELARDYQHHLIQQMNQETLEESDDRFMLAVILLASQPPSVDQELLRDARELLPTGARTRHASLHASLAVVD